MGKQEDALSWFKQGFSCSQSVLAAYGPDFRLDRETALRVAGAFGGGMAGLGETCGAVTGALMVIGLRNGMVDAQDQPAKMKTRELAKDFIRKFEFRHGSVKCRELLGCDIGTSEGMERARNGLLFETLCPEFVRYAVEILEGI
jgi:C_GCAxxG_C_C family probable redox protein